MRSSGSRKNSLTSPKSSSARSLPSVAEIAQRELTKLRMQKYEETIQRAVKPYSPHPPSAKQKAFLQLDVEEAFYGGAAGGGKSDALIHGALQYVDVPGYSAGLFRRTKEDLNKPGNILDRARTWFAGTAAKWDTGIHGFRFPSGATIHFGYATSRQEVEDRYQGTEFHYVGVDELPQWLEEVYRYLFSRLRRLKGFPVPIRMRAAGNPGGRGGEWVRKRFVEFGRHVTTGITAREYIDLRRRGERLPDPPYFESPPSSEALAVARITGRKPQGAYFVPAFASDNPGLDLKEYLVQLARLDPATRQQLEHGDWWVVTGGAFFKPDWFVDRILDVAPAGLRTIRYWDLAGTKKKPGKDPDWSASCRMGLQRLKDGARKAIITDVTAVQEDPGGVEVHVKGVALKDGRMVPIWMEEEPGSAGKANTFNYGSRVLFGYQVHGHRKTGPKPEYWKALSSVARHGNLWLVKGPWNESFIEQLCALTDDDSHAHDDMADAASGALDRLLDDSGAGRTILLATSE